VAKATFFFVHAYMLLLTTYVLSFSYAFYESFFDLSTSAV
jgi:hypothetical protein